MMGRLVAAGMLTLVFVLVPEVVMGPPGTLTLEGPTALEFDANNLVIFDQSSYRRITVAPDGRYLDVRWGPFHPNQGVQPSPQGRHLAWQRGLEGVEFPLGTASLDQEAWADPWRSLVLWNSDRATLVLETLEPTWSLALALVLWPLGCVALALVLCFDLVRGIDRWLTRPAPAFRVAVVTLPLLGLVVGLLWAFQQDAARARETELRLKEMTFLGEVLGRFGPTDAPGIPEGRGYTWVTFGVEGDRIVPRPQDGKIRSYLAAVRSGTVQSFEFQDRKNRGVVVLVPLGGPSGVESLVEVRWDGARPSHTGTWWMWPLVGLGSLWLVSQALGWIVSRPRPKPPSVREPDQVPRRWIEAWGPDLLAPFHHRLPLVRRVVVLSWPADAPPEWTGLLAAAGVVEVDTEAGVCRGLSPGGVGPVARAWDQGGPGWLRVGVKTVSLGLVNTGERLIPVAALPRREEPGSGVSLDAAARRRWPPRVGDKGRFLV